jgi:hypothetical protein
MRIKHEERFTAVEMFAMFNVELWNDDSLPTKKREHELSDLGDCVDNVVLPLWKFREYTPPKGKSLPIYPDTEITDNIKNGVTIHPPGSKERMADLAKFYQDNPEESAFTV